MFVQHFCLLYQSFKEKTNNKKVRLSAKEADDTVARVTLSSTALNSARLNPTIASSSINGNKRSPLANGTTGSVVEIFFLTI